MNLLAPDVPEAEGTFAQDGFADWWRRFLLGEAQWKDPRHPPLRVVDLFSGAGGFGLGAALAAKAFRRRALFSAIADADAAAMATYARSQPVRRRIKDSVALLVDHSVSREEEGFVFDYPPELLDEDLGSEAGSIDLLIAGPPCQGHSNLNNHTRRNDPRNDLFIDTVAIAVALKARAVVIENVPSVTRSHGDVVRIARALFESEGYRVDEGKLKMAELGGWQSRERYFMIAVRGEGPSVAGTLIQWPSVSGWHPSPPRRPLPVLWAIEDLEDAVAEDIFSTPPVQSPQNARRISYLFENSLWDLPLEQRPDCHKGGTTYTAVYGRMHKHRPAPTITTGIGTPGQGRFIHPTRPRLISPREAARIQGFPDNYGFVAANGVATRKSLAKWIGDAVPSLLGMVAVCSVLTLSLEQPPDFPWMER